MSSLQTKMILLARDICRLRNLSNAEEESCVNEIDRLTELCRPCIGSERSTPECKEIKIEIDDPGVEKVMGSNDQTCASVQKALNWEIRSLQPSGLDDTVHGFTFPGDTPCTDEDSGNVMYPMNESSARECDENTWSINIDSKNPFHRKLYCSLYAKRNINSCKIVRETNADNCEVLMPDELCPNELLEAYEDCEKNGRCWTYTHSPTLLNDDENFIFPEEAPCQEDGRTMYPMDDFSSRECNVNDWSSIVDTENPFHTKLFCRLVQERNTHACLEVVGADFDSCEKFGDPKELCARIDKEEEELA
jgi:hypothetical protein